MQKRLKISSMPLFCFIQTVSKANSDSRRQKSPRATSTAQCINSSRCHTPNQETLRFSNCSRKPTRVWEKKQKLSEPKRGPGCFARRNRSEIEMSGAKQQEERPVISVPPYYPIPQKSPSEHGRASVPAVLCRKSARS